MKFINSPNLNFPYKMEQNKENDNPNSRQKISPNNLIESHSSKLD